MRLVLFAFLLLPVLLTGCNLMGGPNGASIKKSIVQRTPQAALKKLKFDDYGESDSVLYYLEKGSLHQMAGQNEKAQASFQAAKEKMEVLYTASISKNIGSVLLNDNATDYEGEYFENIMAHINQAVGYLVENNLENAGVIANQLDVKLDQIENKKKDDNPSKVYKCDPYANYLSGIIYEGLNNRDSARIKYQRAYDCYKKSIFNLTVPKQVKNALSASKSKKGHSSKQKGELVFILDEGFIIEKRETSLSVTTSTRKGIRQVKIAMPEFPKNNKYLLKEVRVKIKSQINKAERVHDLDSAARATLKERLPAIRARAVARAIKNQLVQKNAEENSSLLGQFLTVLATNLIERADVRGWRSLPHTIWMSRSEWEPGTYDIAVELVGKSGQILNIKKFNKVIITKGKKKNLYLRWGSVLTKPRARNTNINLFIR